MPTCESNPGPVLLTTELSLQLLNFLFFLLFLEDGQAGHAAAARLLYNPFSYETCMGTDCNLSAVHGVSLWWFA